jgi:ethanolamine ammonia-lyase large subunit
MKTEHIKDFLSRAAGGPSKWELDTIIWADRTSDLKVLIKFLTRVEELRNKKTLTSPEQEELENLLELVSDLDKAECEELLNQTEEESRESYIEDLARTSAIEVLTNGKLSFETMNISCRLSPNDFILCAKRTQDLINAIHGLVIKGETLSKDVAGA